MFKKTKILSILTVLCSIFGCECYADTPSLKITNKTNKIIYWSINDKVFTYKVLNHGQVAGTQDSKNAKTVAVDTTHDYDNQQLCVSAENYPGCFVRESYDHPFNIDCDTYEGGEIKCLKRDENAKPSKSSGMKNKKVAQ